MIGHRQSLKIFHSPNMTQKRLLKNFQTHGLIISKFSVISYSENLEYSGNVEPNFFNISMFLVYLNENHSNASNTSCKIINL